MRRKRFPHFFHLALGHGVVDLIHPTGQLFEFLVETRVAQKLVGEFTIEMNRVTVTLDLLNYPNDTF